MQKRIKIILALWVLLIGCSDPARAIGTVTVMADNSISLITIELARDYSRTRGTIVNTSFTSPTTQQAQILEGGSADILITPRIGWIDELKIQGLIDIYSQTEVAKNRLALVGPSSSPLKVELSKRFPVAKIIHQIGGEPGFVVGNPQDLLEGTYGKEALRNMDAAQYLEEYTLYIKQLDQMFDMVANQGAYGVFFNSTTVGRHGIRVLDLFPEESHRPIQYYAVVIAGDNMDEARKFLEYLKSLDARRVFHDNGFAVN